MNECKKNKVLAAARSAFLRFGYKRTSMDDLAKMAGCSRPALYIIFKNKEEIFKSVFLKWVHETVEAIEVEMERSNTLEQKLMRAFELWTVDPFTMMKDSLEAEELIECSFEFAAGTLKEGYQMFETAIAPVVALLAEHHPAVAPMSPRQTAHVLASAARGFKQTAATADDLRLLIRQMLVLCFGQGNQAPDCARNLIANKWM